MANYYVSENIKKSLPTTFREAGSNLSCGMNHDTVRGCWWYAFGGMYVSTFLHIIV